MAAVERLLGVLLLCWFLSVASGASTTPEQVHISLAGNPNEMFVVWATQGKTNTSTVKYGLSDTNLDQSITGSSSKYLLSPYIHAAKMMALKAGNQYYYQVGDTVGGWSQVFGFVTETPDRNRPTTFFVIGDHGTTTNSELVLKAMMDYQPLDYLLHAGDLSYADGLEFVWDTWGRMIEPLSNHVPWMVAPGNHELFDLFITYQSRFRMPPNGDKGNLYYSFNYGLIHHITLDSETASFNHLLTQYQWLKRDLEKVDRKVTPWIFALWHSPWYCSNKAHQDSGNRMRESFEVLFQQYDVDMVFTGHVHAYERTLGVYNKQYQANATIYTVIGTGGNREGLYHDWIEPKPEWSAARISELGFGVATVYNATDLYWEFVSAETLSPLDSFSLTKKRAF